MNATNNHRYPLLLLVWATLLIVACSDESDPQPVEEEPIIEEPIVEEPGTEEPSEDLFYTLIRVENLATDESINLEDTSPTVPRQAIYFSLEDSTVKDDSFAKTNRWDLSFSSLYNSFLGSNNGSDPENLGYGANGIGGILILEQNFDDVTEVPADDQFLTGGARIGTDPSGAFGEVGLGTGWYLYDFSGTIMGDGSYEKQHVAYTLQNTRTIVIRTARGNYAKLRMISCYKDAFSPEQWFRDTPHMYFTFEYVLVPAGSAKFEIKP